MLILFLNFLIALISESHDYLLRSSNMHSSASRCLLNRDSCLLLDFFQGLMQTSSRGKVFVLSSETDNQSSGQQPSTGFVKPVSDLLDSEFNLVSHKLATSQRQIATLDA